MIVVPLFNSRKYLAGLLVTAALALPATSVNAEETGRYVLQRAGDGFIRLDTVTGDTAHCALREASWRCEAMDQEMQTRSELRRLQDENAQLRARIEALEKLSAAREPVSGLPSDEEFGRIMDFLDTAMRRFLEMAKTLREEPGKDI